jgi:hypothetical protein
VVQRRSARSRGLLVILEQVFREEWGRVRRGALRLPRRLRSTDEDEPAETVVYCPSCATREFRDPTGSRGSAGRSCTSLAVERASLVATNPETLSRAARAHRGARGRGAGSGP